MNFSHVHDSYRDDHREFYCFVAKVKKELGHPTDHECNEYKKIRRHRKDIRRIASNLIQVSLHEQVPLRQLYAAFCIWIFTVSWFYDAYILIRDWYYPTTCYGIVIAMCPPAFNHPLLGNSFVPFRMQFQFFQEVVDRSFLVIFRLPAPFLSGQRVIRG